jgi:hypothetical protein
MSYCAILEFKGNEIVDEKEFKNAWGGAATIWNALFEKYMKNPENKYDSWLWRISSGKGQDLWDLWKDERLTDCEKIALLATFDRALIKKENFGKFANYLREFATLHPRPKDKVYHLEDWIKFIGASDADLIGFYHNSVGDNPWDYYDLKNNDKHFYVCEEIS